jgi:hypothetical protein
MQVKIEISYPPTLHLETHFSCLLIGTQVPLLPPLFIFCVPRYCSLVLKILMSQDSHHKDNSSQLLKSS